MNATRTAVCADDRLRIDELYARYAACLDDRRFEEWPELFTDDCT